MEASVLLRSFSVAPVSSVVKLRAPILTSSVPWEYDLQPKRSTSVVPTQSRTSERRRCHC